MIILSGVSNKKKEASTTENSCKPSFKIVMTCKSSITCFLLVFSVFSVCESAWAKLVIHSQTAVKIELICYNTLTETPIFKGDLSADSKQEINTPYRGLALLVFAEGQCYPFIIGDESFTLKIVDPGNPPSFTGSIDNTSFYKSLSSGDPVPEQFKFAHLMIQAKQLLKSSYSIHTVKELTTRKQEFHEFVRTNYHNLKHSDMIKQLIAQYFMMHEYIDYRSEGALAADILKEHKKAVLSGVRSWLELLKPHLPEQDILNYCVSLYYARSMVSLASLIATNFKDVAYCSGDAVKIFSFPDNMLITDAYKERRLADFKGNKIIAFVSDDCPVSMVETVVTARRLARQKENMIVIVAPLQKLSSNHLTMAKMIRTKNMFFINDEKWRIENLSQKIKLPLFIRIDDNMGSE